MAVYEAAIPAEPVGTVTSRPRDPERNGHQYDKYRKKIRILTDTDLYLVAGVGFEPHDLRVMSPTSYQTALPRDIFDLTTVPVTGLEPVRYSRITGF